MDNRVPDPKLARMNQLPIPVSVRVCGRQVTLDQFLNWVPGTILTFDQTIESPLEMCVGSQTLGEGEAVKVGDRMGLRLIQIAGQSQPHATAIETR